MADLPHDLTDLYLAPLVLALEVRIEDLGRLGLASLRHVIALSGDLPDWTPDMRQDGLLWTLAEGIELHGWELGIVDRGVKMSHGRHTLVLGVPETFRTYLAGAAASAAPIS